MLAKAKLLQRVPNIYRKHDRTGRLRKC